MSSLDVSRILDSIARELRECLAEGSDTLSLHFEPALLGHCGIPTNNRDKDDQSKHSSDAATTRTCSKQ